MHAEAVGEAERVTRDWTAGRWWLAALNTGTQGDGMALARRTVVWLWLSAVGGGLLLVVVGMVLWMFLPRWAPYWVIDYCPFVEPVVRAWARIDPAPAGTPESAFGFPGLIEDRTAYRLDHFGPKVVPTLLQLLDDADPDVRMHALKYLRPHDLPAVEKLHDLTRDVNPWVRLAAWERLEYEPVEVRYLRPGTTGIDIATSALALLNDVDSYIQRSIVHDLSDQDSLPLSVRQALVSQVNQVSDDDSRDALIEVLSDLSAQEVRRDPDEKLSSEWLFPLLNLVRDPTADAGVIDFVAEQLPLVKQDFGALYAQLAAMQRGERPWELGAQPWMYEQLHGLFTRRVTMSFKDVDFDEVIRACFPKGNVVLDPWIIASAPPPVTMEIDDRPMIEVLIALARILDGRPQSDWTAGLHFDNGVAYLISPARARFGLVHGFVPSRGIGLIPGADPRHEKLVKWEKVLEQRCSVSTQPTALSRWFEALGQQVGLPIDTQEIRSWDWEMDIHLHDLPLKQILCFTASYCDLRMELGPTGLRILPGDPR